MSRVAGCIRRWFARPKSVTHPCTNRARRRVTSFIRPTTLPLRHVLYIDRCNKNTSVKAACLWLTFANISRVIVRVLYLLRRSSTTFKRKHKSIKHNHKSDTSCTCAIQIIFSLSSLRQHYEVINVYRKMQLQLECGPMPNVMVALPNIGGALCSTPQSLADAN